MDHGDKDLPKIQSPTTLSVPSLQGLRQHLLHYKLPDCSLPEGFELYSQLPPLRQQYLQRLASGALPSGVSET